MNKPNPGISRKPFAFVTLLTTISYIPGALTLGISLRQLHEPSSPSTADSKDLTSKEFDTICLLSKTCSNDAVINVLRRAFDCVVEVETISSGASDLVHIEGRPELATALMKLHSFNLTDYSKVIYMDADTLPLKPISHLFNSPHEFAAVPDIGWPDIFNSGVIVLTPDEKSFQNLVSLLHTEGSWDGADQGLLNEWRGSDWHRLSFVYNTTPSAAYMYSPAYRRFGANIKIAHFIGPVKPWDLSEISSSNVGEAMGEAHNSQSTTSELQDKWRTAYHTTLQEIFPIENETHSPSERLDGDPPTIAKIMEETILDEDADSEPHQTEPRHRVTSIEIENHSTSPVDVSQKQISYLNAWDDVPSIIRYSAKLRKHYKNHDSSD